MYIEIDFNLLYQLEKLAHQRGVSVADVVNEAVNDYIERHSDELTAPTPDDAQ